HPGELARLRAEPGLVPCAIEECLRYDGPISLTIRVAHADFELGGKTIPKDAAVVAMLGAANRDPEQFAAPERFDVGRDPNPHLAFGGSTHLCLGAHLARMEAQEAIAALVRGTKSLELAVREDELAYGASL